MTPPSQPAPRYRPRPDRPQPHDPQQAPEWQQFYYPPRPVGPRPSRVAKVLGAIPGVGWMYAGKSGLGIAIVIAWIVLPIIFLLFVTASPLFFIGIIVCILLGPLSHQGLERWRRAHR
jgi:hypothetical protein